MLLIVLMAFMTALCFTFSVSYFLREKTVGIIRYIILFLGLTAGTECLGYTMMSISENHNAMYFWRMVGFFGIAIYIFLELVLVLSQLEMSAKLKNFLLGEGALLLLVDLGTYPLRGSNKFARVNGYTIFLTGDTSFWYFHWIYSGTLIFELLILAAIWMKQQKHKRGRVFVGLCYVSNFMFLLSSIPYYLGIKITMPQFPYTVGIFLAYSVIWFAGIQLSGFSATAQRLGRDIIESVNVPLFVLDPEGVIIIQNPYARKMFQTQRRFNLTLDRIFDITREEAQDYLEEMLHKEELVLSLQSSDKTHSFSLHCTLKKDQWEEPLCIICMAGDTTKEEQMIAEVVAANEAKSDFLANMSHEIRTPINVVLGMNEMVLRESQEKNVIQYAENIQSSGQALLAIINDILDFSKIESGKFEIVEGKYSVASLISDSLNMVYMRAEEKKQQLILQSNPSIPSELIGDEARIRQIYTNLLTNAVKYTSMGGQITFDITASEPDPNGMIMLTTTVNDNGIGIKEENLKDVFVSFQRLEQKRNRNIEGTGLGLSITKHLVEEMGGSITVDSIYGVGTTFTVSIPQRCASTIPMGNIGDKSRAAYKQEIYQSVLRAPDAKILVVDDMEMNLNVFMGLLKPTEISIDKCISGEEALKRIYQKKYDLIFMDHMMPEKDGIETFEEIRSKTDHLNVDTPVIMLSANAISGVREEYLSVGFADYLSKPIQSEQLEKMIMKHLPQEKLMKKDEKEQSEEKASNSILDKLSFLDVETGLVYCAEQEDLYIEIIKEYINSDRRELLEECLAKKDLETYGVYAHSVKSASMTIGALELSAQARLLEEAAKRNDLKCVEDNHWLLISEYGRMLQQLSDILM